MLERCAVSNYIQAKLRNEINSYHQDQAETIESLLNHLFNNDEQDSSNIVTYIAGKKNCSISSSIYNFKIQKDSPLFQKFAKLVCQTDEKGNLIEEKGRYIRDDSKVKVILNNFKSEMNISDKDQKFVEEVWSKFYNLIKQDDTILTFFSNNNFEDPESKMIIELTNSDNFKNCLSNFLKENEPQNSLSINKPLTQNQLCETFISDRLKTVIKLANDKNNFLYSQSQNDYDSRFSQNLRSNPSMGNSRGSSRSLDNKDNDLRALKDDTTLVDTKRIDLIKEDKCNKKPSILEKIKNAFSCNNKVDIIPYK